ncbi:hypothetical protein A4X03_0g7575, partial [Tilletia caries]
MDMIPTIRRIYEQRRAELAAETAAERRDCLRSDHGSESLSPSPSVYRRDGEAKPASETAGCNEDTACSLSSPNTAASDGQEIARIEPVQFSTDGSHPSAEDLGSARFAPLSAVGSSPTLVSVSDPTMGAEKKSPQYEPSLLLFQSSPDQSENRHSCSVDCGVPSGIQEGFENVLPVEEDIPPDIYASPSPPSGVPNFSDLLFDSVSHHDVLCLPSTRTTTTFAIGKKQGCTVNRSSPSPASIRLDVPAPVQATAHGSPSLLLSPSVAFAIGYVPASVTQRAPATIARTDSPGVSTVSVAGSWEQRAGLPSAVSAKPRLKALQRLFLSAKAKRDSIQSFHLRPAHQNIALGSLFLDDDQQSGTLECGTRSTAPSAFKGPLGSTTGGTSSSFARSAPIKKASDRRFLRPVQPAGMKLSSAFTSPSTSLTPLEPTGPGPPSFGGYCATSFPDAPSKTTSALHYACDRSTARGGRVSVDELGRNIVSKLHRTDIEQSRITTDPKHHSGIGVPKLPVTEQTYSGGSAIQQQQAGVSPMSLKVGRDPQGVKVYAALDTVGRTDSSSLGWQPVLEGEVEGGSVVERVMAEGAMTEGAMTERAVKEGVVAGGDEDVKPVVKETKRLGPLTEVIVPCGSMRTTMQSETWSQPLPPPLATRVSYRPIVDPQSTPPTESQPRCPSRAAASTDAATPAASTPPPAASSNAPRPSCPGVGLESREVQPTESRRRPRAAADAAEGAVSVSQVSRLGAADHSHSVVKSCGSFFSPAQPLQRRSAEAALEAASQGNGMQWRMRPGGAQQRERRNKEGDQQDGMESMRSVQEGAQPEGAQQEGATADMAVHASGTVALYAISHVDSERPVPTARVRRSTACANTTATCFAFRNEEKSPPPPASSSPGCSVTLKSTAASWIPTFLCVYGDLSINEDLAAAVPSHTPVPAITVIASLSANDTACRDSQESHPGHVSISTHARTITVPHPRSSTLGSTTSTRTGYVHCVGSGRLRAVVVVGGMRISSAPSADGMQMFKGICVQGCMERQDHFRNGMVRANDAVMVRGTNGIGQNMPSIMEYTFGQTRFTIEHATANHQLISWTKTATTSTACFGGGPPPFHIEHLAERGMAAGDGLTRRNASAFRPAPSPPTALSRATGKSHASSNRTAIQAQDHHVGPLLFTVSATGDHSASARQHREPFMAIDLVHDTVESHATHDHTVRTVRRAFLCHPTVVSRHHRRLSTTHRRGANQSAHSGSVFEHAFKATVRAKLAHPRQQTDFPSAATTTPSAANQVFPLGTVQEGVLECCPGPSSPVQTWRRR